MNDGLFILAIIGMHLLIFGSLFVGTVKFYSWLLKGAIKQVTTIAKETLNELEQ